MLSVKQEAICRALQNNEILIPLKKEEQSNVCLKAYAQRNNLNSINVYTILLGKEHNYLTFIDKYFGSGCRAPTFQQEHSYFQPCEMGDYVPNLILN